jgi:hypothetical protein
MEFLSSARLAVLASAVALAAVPAAASVTLTFSADGPNGFAMPGQPDYDFERAGGYLDVVRGLPAAPGGSHLVPIERVVTQVRASNTRNGIYLPDAETGLPVADGGTGVVQALTNRPPYLGGNNTAIGNGVATDFSVTRVGNIITFTLSPLSGPIVLASDARTSLGLVNAFSIRLRTVADSSISYTNLTFTDSSVTAQALADIGIGNGQTAIRLFEGIAPGDFTLTGTLTRSWTGGEPSQSNLATQIKFLELPPIPEPGTWAMMIAGFGMVGSALRRRRVALA